MTHFSVLVSDCDPRNAGQALMGDLILSHLRGDRTTEWAWNSLSPHNLTEFGLLHSDKVDVKSSYLCDRFTDTCHGEFCLFFIFFWAFVDVRRLCFSGCCTCTYSNLNSDSYTTKTSSMKLFSFLYSYWRIVMWIYALFPFFCVFIAVQTVNSLLFIICNIRVRAPTRIRTEYREKVQKKG